MLEIEICLVVIGLICVACSFLFSEHLMSGDIKDGLTGGVNVAGITEEIVKREVEAEIANVIDDKVEELEVKLDKLTTEKIMAMGDYSNDIQEKITQNHDEVMFLYNMLNDKEEVLKNTIRDIEALKSSVKKMTIVNDTAEDITPKKEKTERQKTTSDTAAIASAQNESQPKKNIRRREMSNNNQMILKLYSQGKSNIEIAKELGLGIGEVRLVIDLYNSR